MRYVVFSILIASGFAISSCKDKIICPAFQSTYILNDSIRAAKYSLFGQDSLPKYQVASRRNKYGISEKYRLFNFFRKNYDLRTAPKENVLGPPAKDSLFVHPEDSIELMDVGEFVASDFADSLSSDTLGVVPDVVASAAPVEPTGPKYKYRYDQRNPYSTEQIYYNKYFGELLVDNRPPPKPIEPEIEEGVDVESDSTEVSSKKKFGFLKKKKKKDKNEELEEAESEDDALDELEEGE